MTVMQERGNKFIRIERSARGKEGNVTNDPYFDFIDTKYPEIIADIKETKALSAETEQKLISAINEHKETFLKTR